MRNAEKRIKKHVEAEKCRFSVKKFKGDLAEFYFREYAISSGYIRELKQFSKGNASYDFDGKIAGKKRKIEVKSRQSNTNTPYLQGVHPGNFDYLAFVRLGDDYLPVEIILYKSAEIVNSGAFDRKRNRCILSDKVKPYRRIL